MALLFSDKSLLAALEIIFINFYISNNYQVFSNFMNFDFSKSIFFLSKLNIFIFMALRHNKY